MPYAVAPATGLSKVSGTVKINGAAPVDAVVSGTAKGAVLSVSGAFLSAGLPASTVVILELNSGLANPMQQYTGNNFSIRLF